MPIFREAVMDEAAFWALIEATRKRDPAARWQPLAVGPSCALATRTLSSSRTAGPAAASPAPWEAQIGLRAWVGAASETASAENALLN